MSFPSSTHFRDFDTTTIANGSSLAPAIDIGPNTLVAVVMPAAWDAAAMTFAGSIDGTNFFPLYDETGTEINIPVAASRYVKLDPSVFAGVRYVQVRSGTSGSAVNQTANRVITLVA